MQHNLLLRSILFTASSLFQGWASPQACHFWAGPGLDPSKLTILWTISRTQANFLQFLHNFSYTWYFLAYYYFPLLLLLLLIYDTKMHIIKKIKVVDKTKGQIMPSNNSASSQGTMTVAAPTTKSNSNWLFYNRFIKKEVLFTIMTLRLTGNVYLTNIKKLL